MVKHVVAFDSVHQPLELEEQSILSEHLHMENSPVLFGCRTGICGTCLVEVTDGHCALPSPEEQELLDIVAPGNSKARLACQLKVTGFIKIKYVGTF